MSMFVTSSEKNYTPFEGDDSFLARADQRTLKIWEYLPHAPRSATRRMTNVNAKTPSTITAHEPGYIDEGNEVIVGLQTDAPLKRASCPTAGGAWVEGVSRPTATRLTRS